MTDIKGPHSNGHALWSKTKIESSWQDWMPFPSVNYLVVHAGPFSFLILDATHAVPFPGSLMRHLAPLGSQAWNIEQDVETTGIDCGWKLSCLNGKYTYFKPIFRVILNQIIVQLHTSGNLIRLADTISVFFRNVLCIPSVHLIPNFNLSSYSHTSLRHYSIQHDISAT